MRCYALRLRIVAKRFAKGERPEDLVSLMIAAEGRDGITQANVIDNLLILVLGALDTTVRWMGNLVVLLHRHPGALADVRSDLSLLPQAAEEAMRVESVVNVNLRIVNVDGIELCGQALHAGDFVYTLPAAANRDPQWFERPGEFDIHPQTKASSRVRIWHSPVPRHEYRTQGSACNADPSARRLAAV